MPIDKLREAALASLAEMTDEEDAAINAGIARDPDAREWTDEDFANARPYLEVFPDAAKDLPRRRGRPKLDDPKVNLTLRLDRDIIDGFKATGPGWQTRINEALREAMPGRKTG
jgi:uncharacterized protein (DUF4415 family)